jgi:hypothetical protein
VGTEQFYWDADNINIYNPNNEDQQIRIGKYDNENYGIGFTEDGGNTWESAIGFDGIRLGSLTINDINSQLKQVKVEIVSSEGTVYNEDIMPSLPTVLTARIIVGTIPQTDLTGYNFQWQKSEDSGTSWANISGATASTYQYNATISEQVRCMVTK